MSKKEIISIVAVVLFIAGIVSCGGASQDSSTDSSSVDTLEVTGSEGGAIFSAESDSYDFGQIKEGQKVEHEFVFVNTGTTPLIVQQVSASCGCTTPEYSKNPIVPGGEGKIKVVFDSEGQLGQHHKIISVMTNSEKKVVLLHLRGEVTPKS